ncbi:fatty-acid amide hydrolase 1 isoform X2 [Folsomia candida]|uniref:fatty-acid amide hydrolase 1 isoform X2 n=1 Tax=Folsomia candida TaxID=158441 RepID=UPI0016055356|nr:fatty-acid amide hydrolase 1 isoform X2 [Folsomia candida]
MVKANLQLSNPPPVRFPYFTIDMLRTRFEAFCGFILLLLSILTSALLPILGHIYFKTSDRKKLKTNADLISKKDFEREEQFQAIETQFPLNGKRQKILKLSEEKLINALQTRILSATEVLEAYISKEWASELDSLEQIKGPLHGIPVSIKEHCNVVGMDSTMGFAQFLFRPAQEDAAIVQAIKLLGGIPFCKTNVPQSLFTYACGNSIFGETLNPLNLKLSPGGSSGGCATLIAAGGSILGVGTDVGGSIRIPAHFCGIAGLKPTMPRMTQQGFRTSGAIMVPISGTNGFLARNTKMLCYAYKSLYESGILTDLDPNAVPIPWNENLFNPGRKLRFGFFTSHSMFPLLGDTEEVLMKAINKLQADGHEVVQFLMPDMEKIMEVIWDSAFADRGKVFKNLWKAESISDAAITVYWMTRLPLYWRRLIAYILEFKMGPIKLPIFYSPLTAKLLRSGTKTWTSEGLWRNIVDRKLMLDYIKGQFLANNIDLLITPAFPFPAIPYNMPGKILQAVVYTMPWNLMDFPAGVARFGRESGTNFHSYSHQDDFILRLAQKGAKQSIGMPIGLQIVGLPYQEELVLRGMTILESLR